MDSSFQIATVIARPSKTCKSPYVADIQLDADSSAAAAAEVALCHTPGLGCSGLVAPGRKILVTSRTGGTTRYSAQIAVCEDAEGPYSVGLQPMQSQALAAHVLGRIAPSAIAWDAEVVVEEGTRLDYVGRTAESKKVYVEVKNAMISKEVDVPRKFRRAIFPDGYRRTPTDPISPRAIKHAKTLAALRTRPDTDACILLYILPRSDCHAGLVLNPDDPAYCSAVWEAICAGVQVRAFAATLDATDATPQMLEVPIYFK